MPHPARAADAATDQLPPDVMAFTGRAIELKQLTAIAAEYADSDDDPEVGYPSVRDAVLRFIRAVTHG